MNRVAHWPANQAAPKKSPPPLDLSNHFDDQDVAKAVFVPLRYQSSHAYPLLVWLHDVGEHETAMRRMVPRASLRNFLAVGVRGTLAIESSSGYTWQQATDGIQAATSAVMSSVQSMKQRYHIDSDHVFIAGSGAGGTMALRIAHDYADHFAGCASLGGPFPAELRPLRAINRSRGLRVLLAHSEAIAEYPTSQFCDDVRLLFCAGGQVLFRQYGGTEDLYKPMLRDLNRWLMGIVTRQFLLDSHDIQLGSFERN